LICKEHLQLKISLSKKNNRTMGRTPDHLRRSGRWASLDGSQWWNSSPLSCERRRQWCSSSLELRRRNYNRAKYNQNVMRINCPIDLAYFFSLLLIKKSQCHVLPAREKCKTIQKHLSGPYKHRFFDTYSYTPWYHIKLEVNAHHNSATN